MQAVVDSINGEYVRCLVENGDLLNIHSSDLPEGVEVGDVLTLSFTKDDKSSKRQKELMQ